jgi:hypothetical protein
VRRERREWAPDNELEASGAPGIQECTPMGGGNPYDRRGPRRHPMQGA